VEALLSRATDADYWRAMAKEALALAEEMTDAESKRSMLEIAAGYELLANGAKLDVLVARSSPARASSSPLASSPRSPMGKVRRKSAQPKLAHEHVMQRTNDCLSRPLYNGQRHPCRCWLRRQAS
jgi:hypothetical protein